MDGDISPIKEICDLADKYGAMTYRGEVHAVGIVGPARWRSWAAIKRDRALLIRSFACGFIFTTALPPCSPLVRSLRHGQSEPHLAGHRRPYGQAHVDFRSLARQASLSQ